MERLRLYIAVIIIIINPAAIAIGAKLSLEAGRVV